MGALQQCCFEDRIRKKGIIRLINNNNIIDNTTNLLRNYQKNKKKPKNKQKEETKNNNSYTPPKGENPEVGIILNNETSIKIPENQNINENDDIHSSYTYNKIIRKRKNKSCSMDCSKSTVRSNTFNFKKKNGKTDDNEKIYHKKDFMKGNFMGQGRYGKIYSGLNELTGELVIIKVYHNITESQKNKIINNIDNLYKLNHKNIIKAIPLQDKYICSENEEFSIIYESVNSKNVKELIKNVGSLDEKIIQAYIKQLLEGLKYLHANKVYHKNLKPNNILVDIDGTIKISDCLVDNLILGEDLDIYNNLLSSDKIEFYIPPFFIQSINQYKEQKYSNNEYENKDKNNFNDWQSYDLWFLGCLMIEVSSRKKPWSHYKFKNNSEFIEFLGSINLVPTIPQKLSCQCQELIKILFNYSMTKQEDIYDIIFNLDFFKMDPNDFTYNILNNNINDLRSSLNDTLCNICQSEDSNVNLSHIALNESENGSQFGQVLENHKVVNILNNNNNASFSVSCTVEENSLSFSQSFLNNKLSQTINNKLNQSIISKGKSINNININKFKNAMPEVEEAQIEQSPDPIKNDEEKNFNFTKQ